MFCDLLPNLYGLDACKGDPLVYIDNLYKYYKEEIKYGLTYNGKPISCRKSPIFDNKEDSFHHLTCKCFEKNEDREPDLRRCERLTWIKPGIMGDHKEKHCFKMYIKEIRGTNKIHLFDEQDRYLIVLEERKTYVLLVTAFYIQYDNVIQKKRKELQNYLDRTE